MRPLLLTNWAIGPFLKIFVNRMGFEPIYFISNLSLIKNRLRILPILYLKSNMFQHIFSMFQSINNSYAHRIYLLISEMFYQLNYQLLYHFWQCKYKNFFWLYQMFCQLFSYFFNCFSKQLSVSFWRCKYRTYFLNYQIF